MKSIILVTDGACAGNPGPGGWAYLTRYRGRDLIESGSESRTTNNRMELQAVIEGLRSLKDRCRVRIVVDSKYVMNGFVNPEFPHENGWVEKWKRTGWRAGRCKGHRQIRNRDLWEQLDQLVGRHEVTWHWIKGHSGDPDNTRVDERAQAEAQRLKARIEAQTVERDPLEELRAEFQFEITKEIHEIQDLPGSIPPR